jgi:hypothetical protein
LSVFFLPFSDILHLPAGSPDAKVFAGFANITGSVAAPVASGKSL